MTSRNHKQEVQRLKEGLKTKGFTHREKLDFLLKEWPENFYDKHVVFEMLKQKLPEAVSEHFKEGAPERVLEIVKNLQKTYAVEPVPTEEYANLRKIIMQSVRNEINQREEGKAYYKITTDRQLEDLIAQHRQSVISARNYEEELRRLKEEKEKPPKAKPSFWKRFFGPHEGTRGGGAGVK